jgi:cytidine deaminase
MRRNSKFVVGAAVKCESGDVLVGANIENRSFGLTICAERVAMCAAVTGGEQDFVAIAVTADSDEPIVPCGACRQFLAEFNPDLPYAASGTSKIFRIFSPTRPAEF